MERDYRDQRKKGMPPLFSEWFELQSLTNFKLVYVLSLLLTTVGSIIVALSNTIGL